MYGLAPFAPDQTLNLVFVIAFYISTIILIYAQWWAYHGLGPLVTYIVILVVLGTTYVVFDPDDAPQPDNIKVTGTLEGYASGANHGSKVNRNTLYVVYKIDDTLVTFPASTGQAYPKYAIIYKKWK